ncbi:transporter substrate-binding domain-containing protein [Bacillus sp. BRMEA1]|uniref:transporter substrate-binding domain-containing protein n=1 Tax=Neobacillus endophyticus TaxID=2738405 RepID=UPI00156459E5|nr:transporter substrate-binding domain-containing protein [Neobacillus endophyticus]NRD79735.1 transporter substrate-binding domain-containing protein [Neobacillus endophyticus]
MKKTYGWSLLLLFTLFLINGCSHSSNSSEDTATSEPIKSIQAKNIQQIIVGTSGTFPKVTYFNENQKLTGYDIELVKEIDKRLPNYQFTFQTMDFSNLLLSLSTNKIDFVTNEMEKNKERSQKYLFNKEPYAFWKTYIIVAKTNQQPIRSLDDLKGKKVLTSATSAEANLLETYNKEHHNAIQIVYTNGASNDTVSQITSGRVDATLGADFSLSLIDPQGKLKIVGDSLASNGVYFVFRKNDPKEQQLADQIDQALSQIKKDGTLSKLSVKWLGQDYTTNLKAQ